MNSSKNRASLSAVLAVARSTRNEFNFWRRSGCLRTHYRDTTPPIPRELSRDNALEIAFMKALKTAGLMPSTGAAYTASFLRVHKSGRLGEWFVFAAGDPQKGLSLDTLSADKLTERFGADDVPVLTIVYLGEIVRRVDALFEVGGEEHGQ